MIHRHLFLAWLCVMITQGLGGCSKSDGESIPVANAAPEAPAVPVDPQVALDQQWGEVLAAVVSDEGLVRYDALGDAAKQDALRAVVEGYGSVTLPADLNARKAFWCNAHNANVLVMTLDESRKAGFKSVKDVPGFFDEATVRVAGIAMTLEAVQKELRQMSDPRVHAALTLGGRSSPPMRAEPYSGDQIERQLDDQCRRWLDDPGKNRAERDRVLVSDIFKWHEPDFAVSPYAGVKDFLMKHSRPRGLLRDFMTTMKEFPISHLKFDWSLNKADS